VLDASERATAELARRIHGRSHLTGEFALRSGAVSHEYFDKYLFESDPLLLREVAEALVAQLPDGIDALAGLELGGVPLATLCSQVSGLPTLFVRKHAKEYGTRRLAEGGQIKGRRLAVIEDVVTSGWQVLESCRELRAQGATVAVVLCVIDREGGGADSLAREGLEVRCLFTRSDLDKAVGDDPLVAPDATLIEIVEAVRALWYGRPTERTVEAMLRDRRGTCSTKHLYLARTLADRFPETEPHIVHRVYRLHHDRAAELYGKTIAENVPSDGLVDVHRYLRITLNGQCHTLDATFPGEQWDGRSSLPLACGEGDDFPASGKPDDDKRDLEAQHCDPAVREPFIAALAIQLQGGV
jgi:orotate phosphoribosyltransferase